MVPEYPFSNEELRRYSRHIILPKFGLSAQEKLKIAKVLVVGSGGLGSPLLLYLAAAGVGTIGIIDFDSVDETNLQRQVLFDTADIGKSKAEVAGQKVQALNPHVHVKIYKEKLSSANALTIISDYDIVADGTDNFPTRYLVNDACVLSGKPYVYGSVFQFEGQISLFNYKNKKGGVGPNYRDLYPTPPPPESVPDCASGGVLGVLPGIIGSMQALEVMKTITGIGENLSGKFWVFDALAASSKTFTIKRTADNPLNGKHPTITSLIDYDDFCGMSASGIKEISVEEFLKLKSSGKNFQLIDVREPDEYEIGHIGGDLIPFKTLENNINRIDKKKQVILHCESGSRSRKAILLLQEKFSFSNLYNLTGGLAAYKQKTN